MAGLRGDLNSIKNLMASLQRLPVVLAQDIASRAAPAMTGLAREAHRERRGVYGEPRPIGADGERLTLERTGATLATLRFVHVGTQVRCVLGTPYAKYLIGKYSILPSGPPPRGWLRRLSELTKEAKPL